MITLVSLLDSYTASSLPPKTLTQQAELIALTRALTLAKDKVINVYTDSKYTYNIIHSNILIWREGERFLNTKENTHH
jgi:ribonuclease HI